MYSFLFRVISKLEPVHRGYLDEDLALAEITSVMSSMQGNKTPGFDDPPKEYGTTLPYGTNLKVYYSDI